jgi:ribosome maturation factor RimP
LKIAAQEHRANLVKDEDLIQLLTPIIADLGLECLGIEYAPSRGNSLLRVYIDAADRPITLDDCEAVSREVSAALDVNDPISGRYTLEISSPGLDRPLFTPAQFARFIGEQAKVALNLPVQNRRRLLGTIKAVEGDAITIEQDGVDVTITHDNVQKAKLVPDLEALGLMPEPKKGGKKPAPKGDAKAEPKKPKK